VKHWLIFVFVLVGRFGYSQKTLLFKDAIIPTPHIDRQVKSWIESQPAFDELSSTEQNFYYWVNYSRANPRRFLDSVVIPITEVYPQLKGEYFESLRSELMAVDSLPMLVLNGGLIRLAKNHAIDITSHDTKPSHNSTNGDTFSDRFRKEKFQKCGAENLSFGEGEPLFLLTLLYLDIDVPGLGHRKTLLNAQYRETGIGAKNFKNGSIFLVEDFACAQD
jgi:Cysteine-rich secretory protein family